LAMSVGLHFVAPITIIVSPPYTYFGSIAIIFGIALNIWSVVLLRTENTNIEFSEAPNKLIIRGAFRISRNPIYLSGVIVSLGIAVLLGSLITFLFPIALLLILDRVYIPFEEAKLYDTFGEEYVKYRKKVRRWL
jgi:protein-S-isoprenylcysteine O-methyltransferase Ste14